MSLISSLVDWVIIVIVAVAGGILFYITGWHRPFSVTDLDISYPDRPDIISLPVLIILALLVPAAIIIIASGISHLLPGSRTTWRQAFYQLNTSLTGLGLALAVTLFLTSGLKDIVGKPRPNLLARCMPDVTQLANYTAGGLGSSIDSEAGVLVHDGICQQANRRLLDDGFGAFPSGHSSFSSAGLIFLSIWLAALFRIPLLSPILSRTSRSWMIATASSQPLWQLALALAPAVVALFVCASRYADFHHAGIDIFAGAVIGTLCAITSFRLYFSPTLDESRRLVWTARRRAGLTGRLSNAKRRSNHDMSGEEYELSRRDEELGRADTFDSRRQMVPPNQAANRSP